MSKRSTSHPPEEPTTQQPHGDDEFVYVPKGKSKGAYILTLVVMIFILVFFTVGDQLVSSAGGSSRGTDTYLSWTHPTKGTQNMSAIEFQRELQALDDFFRVQGRRGARSEDLADRNVAGLIITDALAREAGIEVTDRELAATILEGEPGRTVAFGSKDVYVNALRASGITSQQFETTLRRMMRTWRYENLMAAAVGQPNPEEVERLWREENTEYAFDLIEVDHEAFESAITSAIPPDDELKDWYEGLPAQQKQVSFAAEYLPARVSGQLVGVRLGGDEKDDVSVLMERYPLPEGTDPDQLARDYYEAVKHIRFRREEPLETEDPEVDRFFHPFEEVADACREEAPIRAAMAGWRFELVRRVQADEVFDFLAEAQELGLHVETIDEPMGQVELSQVEGFAGGPFIGNALMRPVDGGFSSDVITEKDSLVITRQGELIPYGPAPFEDIRDRVAEVWKERRGAELAAEQLDQIFQSMRPDDAEGDAEGDPEAPIDGMTAEAFAAVAEGANLQVTRFDWFNPRTYFKNPDEDQSNAAEFLMNQYRSRAPIFGTLEEGQVAAPITDRSGERSWIVRVAGKREPPVVAIEPADYQRLRQQATYSGYGILTDTILNPDAYSDRFDLKFYLGEEAAEEEPQG